MLFAYYNIIARPTLCGQLIRFDFIVTPKLVTVKIFVTSTRVLSEHDIYKINSWDE